MTKAVRFAAMIVATMLLAACGNDLPTYRYKLTVEVQTPEGLRTGSSVIEVRTSPSAPLQPGGIVSRVRGEAVAVDLGRAGTLFVLLSSRNYPNNAAGIAPSALLPVLPDRQGTAEAWGNNLRILRKVTGRAEVPFSSYPMLVHFRDIQDSRTVEEVQPNNLTRAFGAGVRLVRISVEITDEPVSSNIRDKLQWLGEYPEPRLDPVPSTGPHWPLGRLLSYGDFVRDR